MADYDAYDEETLQRMANDAESYEERSAIRQALRRKKKGRGENVGRLRARGNSVYNRFAGSTAPKKQATPKNFVVSESEAAGSQPAAARPPSSGGGSGKGSSRGSTTPTQRESASSPVVRPQSPTPPPTPEQPIAVSEEPVAEDEEGENEEQEGGETDQVDIEEAKAEEAPLSPPPSPKQQAEPTPQEEDVGEGEEVDGSERTPAAELPEQIESESYQEEEVEEERVASPVEEGEAAAVVKEEVLVSGKEDVDSGSRRGREEREPASSGGARFGGVTLRSRHTDSTPSPKQPGEQQNEFLNLKLRQTSRDGSGGRGRKVEPEPKVNFGVKLKTAPRDTKPLVTSPPANKRDAAGSDRASGGPRTLKDYQELNKSSAAKGKAKRGRDEDFEQPSLEPDELQKYLVAYVNSELGLHPPLPVKGGALFETCSNPTNLCKLVNKSVPNTVDLRALTKISPSSSEDQKREARQENMTLALESARAIGCRVSDDTSESILNRHPQTIRDFLVDLIRAKAVNLPGMDDEPSSTFSNMATLFEKLSISLGNGVEGEESVDVGQPSVNTEEVSWRDDREKVRKALESPPPKVAEKESWRETVSPKPTSSDTTEMSYEERAAMRRAQRERKAKQAEESGGVELSYEERAAQRRADRERRRREREALAK